MRIEGVFHIHSSFSHDGEQSLYELSCYLEKSGIDFCILADHLEDFEEKSFKDYLAQIREINSTRKFLFIPGVEIALGVVHIIVFPLDEYPINSLSQLLQNKPEIISVLAHPSKLSDDETKSVIDDVMGFELWNQRADGNHFPSFRFIKKAKVADIYHSKTIFFGVDLHDASSQIHNRIVMNLENNELATPEIVLQLQSGNFTNVHVKRNLKIQGNQSSKEVELIFSLLEYIRWHFISFLYACLRVGYSYLGQYRKSKIVDYIKKNLKRLV